MRPRARGGFRRAQPRVCVCVCVVRVYTSACAYMRAQTRTRTDAQLYDLFGRYGAIRQIRKGNTKETRGTAFVVYEDIYE
jgi:hypothetical protein